MIEDLSAFLERFHDYRLRTWAAALPVEQDALKATFERLELEKWYSEDHIKCESLHRNTGPESCSIEVTHIVTITCKNATPRVCAVSANWTLDHIGPERCECGRPTADCWHVWPI